MTVRVAACRCGQLTVECAGEPVRVSVCHCLNCQRRSGSAFAAQARFPAEAVTTRGESTEWVPVPDGGPPMTFHFCPKCGSTGWFQGGTMPDLIAVPVGNFADPRFPAPHYSVWEARKHQWVAIDAEGLEHYD